MSKTIKIPVKLYDALRASAKKYGGIGAGGYNDESGAPLCAVGHAVAVHAVNLSFNTGDNDLAVRAVNRQRRRPRDSRIPWGLWVKAMRVRRGVR